MFPHGVVGKRNMGKSLGSLGRIVCCIGSVGTLELSFAVQYDCDEYTDTSKRAKTISHKKDLGHPRTEKDIAQLSTSQHRMRTR